MSLKNLFRNLSLLLVALTFLGGSLLAADFYVNDTNGDDLNGDGTSGNPYKTITKALAEAALVAGTDNIYVAADEYGDEGATLTFGTDVNVIVQTFQGRNDVLLTGTDIDVDADVDIASTGTNDFRFDSDLTLTSGTLTTVTANFSAEAANILVTVIAGSIVGTPDYGNNEVDVTYNHGAARANSDELAADLNGGTITNAPAGAFALTINKAVTAGQLINSAARTVIFTAAPTFEGDAITLLAINNMAGGTIDFQAGATVEDDVTNTGSTIKLNNQTLTTVGAVAFANVGGGVISATAGTVGDGLVYATGAGAVTVDGGEFPNLTVPAAFTGTFTLGGDLALFGDFLLSADQASAFNDGGNDFQVYGDFVRDDDTPGNYVAVTAALPGGGTLSFLGSQDQLFDPGASLTLNNVYVDNNNGGLTSYTVTMDASVEVVGYFDILTDGMLELANFNIRMSGTGGQIFTNDGQYISSPGTGYLIFESGAGDNITGTGLFNNIDVRDDVQPPVGPFTSVTMTSDILFSGILRVRDGLFDYNGNDLLISSDLVTTPHIYLYTDDGDVQANGGDLDRPALNTTTLYNLTFLETTNRTVDGELTATSGLLLNNLSVNTTTGAVIDGVLADGNVHGVLDVDGTEFFDLGGFTYDLTGDGPAGGGLNHPIAGRVQNGELSVQDDGSSITGSNDDAHESAVDFLTIDLAAGETFTSTLLQEITGDLVHNNGTSNIQMTDDDAVAPAGPIFTGDLVLNDGTLTFGMTDNGNLINSGGLFGGADLNDGTLILGSDLVVFGITNQTDAEIQLNTNTFEVQDLYTHDGTGAVTGSVGWFHVTYANGAANDPFTLTEPLSVSNFMFDGAVEVDLVTDDLTVTNLYEHTSGDFDLNGNDLLFSGTDFEYVAGTLDDEAGGSTLVFNGTTQNLNLNADFTLNGAGDLDFELDQTASQLNIVDVSAPTSGHDFIIEGLFTMTNGDIELNNNSLVAQGNWTRVAGNITGGGFFVLDGGNTYDQGPATFSVERLAILNGNADFPDEQPWRVEEYLLLGYDVTAGSLEPGDDNALGNGAPQLTIADDATIERQDDGSTLDDDAAYDGGINLAYTTDGSATGWIETSDEASATTIYDFLAQVVVRVDRDFTVRDMITIDRRTAAPFAGQLDSDIFDLDANGDDVVSLGADGWVTLIDVGGDNAFVDPLNPLGTINVDYDNATGAGVNTSDNELNSTFTIGDVIVDGNTDADDVQTHEALSFGGNLQIMDSGDLDMNGNNLTLTGGFVQASDGTIVNEGALANLWFGGAADWTFDAGGDDWMIGDPAAGTERNYRLGVNTATADVQVTLADGNLDFATFGQTLYLTLGMITTLDNVIMLEQQSDANAEQGSLNTQPTQGFVRAGDSHVVGNVRKYLGHQNADGNINNGAAYDASIALTRVEFPVGAAPTSPSAYRPFALAFNTLPTASTNITVNHVNTRPSGENGMPIATNEGFTITNFSDFYWTMYSDITLQPQVQYDIEARAEGYRAQYEEDEVEDIRFVRKYANNTNNPWVLQGSSGYDNSTDDNGPGTADDEAVVIAKDAVGAVASQGAIFAYSQNNKAPFFIAALGNITITEGDTVDFDFMVTDPDIGQTGSIDEAGSTIPMGTLTEVNDTTSNLTWVTGYYDAGVYTYTVRSADGFDTRDTTFTITVLNNNRPIAIDYTGDSGDTVYVGEGDQLALQFTSTDPDTNDTPTYSIVAWSGPAGAAMGAATGLFTYTPAFGEVGMVYQLDARVADGSGSTADTTAYVAVVKTNRAPVIAGGTADTTITENQLLQVAYSATDADADNLTYSVVEASGDSTGAMMVANVFTWTPDYTQAGVYDFWVIATDDGAPNKSDSSAIKVTVTDINAAPYFTVTPPADTTIAVGETFTFQYEAEDPDQDVLVFSFGDQYPDNATLDPATGIVTWTPSETAVWAFRLLVTDPSGLYDSTQSLIRALEYTVTVSGTVTYNNGGAAAIEGAEVSVATETDSTDAAGNYSVADIPSGTYTVSAMKTGSTGGILASDALKAALFALDSATHPLNDLAQLAADVNNSGSVTGADAQLILQKVVDNTVVFDRGDWVFTSEEVTLVSTNAVANLQGMVVGDVNGSYTMTPSPALSKDGGEKVNAVTALQSENIQIKPEQEFELPVSYSGALTAGAVTLQFSYPVDKLEFISVKAPVNFVYKDVDGVITLAWADFTGKKPLVVEDSEILVFKFKATDKFSKQEIVNLTLEDKSEIADVDGKVYKSSQISVPGIEQAIPKEFALSQNYPNPFNPSTVINYDLPENGDVKLVVYNMLGEEVTRLVNTAQEAGSYKVQWNAVNFASGVYIYRITVEGVKNFVQTKKMILVK